MIQLEFGVSNPLGLTEFPFSAPNDDNGALELAVATPTGLEIGEIKPGNPKGLEDGIDNIRFYHRALKAAFAKKNPTMTVGPLIRGVPPLEFPTLSPDCPVQTLTVKPPFLVDSPPKGAVYQYNCTPEFKELKKQGCKCNPSPPPIPIDVKQRQDEKDKEKKKEKDKEGSLTDR